MYEVFSGPDAVALGGVDEKLDVGLGGGLEDAVAEVEDVLAGAAGAGYAVLDGFVDGGVVAEEEDGVDVALHGHVGSERLARLRHVDGPVERDGVVGAGLAGHVALQLQVRRACARTETHTDDSGERETPRVGSPRRRHSARRLKKRRERFFPPISQKKHTNRPEETSSRDASWALSKLSRGPFCERREGAAVAEEDDGHARVRSLDLLRDLVPDAQ